MITKGKWTFCKDGICDYGFLIGVNFDKGVHERQIASVHCKSGKLKPQGGWPDIYPTEQEAQANARLIAAAPKLLEALEHILEYWNKDENPTAMSDALWHILETAEKAIAELLR